MANEEIKFDESGKRYYELGLSNVVLYKQNSDGSYQSGVNWDGASALNESPEGADETKIFADNKKYLSLFAAEEFGFTLEAYSYPIAFDSCNGIKHIMGTSTKATRILARVFQQPRDAFGLAYRTEIGSDTDAAKPDGDHYKIHIVYNARAGVSDVSHATIDDNPDAEAFSWDCTTTKVVLQKDNFPDPEEGIEDPYAQYHGKATSYFEIDSADLSSGQCDILLDKLWGKDGANGNAPTLPKPEDVIVFLKTGEFPA